MPIYCYRCPACGEVAEVFRHAAADGPPSECHCDICGDPAERDYQAECAPGRRAEAGETVSMAAGVMPAQAAAAERAMQRRGIDGVRFDRRTGNAIFANRSARLRALKAAGWRDRDEIRG